MSATATTAAGDARDPWAGLLDHGDEILWQGRPDTGIALKGSTIFLVLFGLAFSGFALVWMILAASAGGMFWAFGLIHFSAGLGLIFFAIWGDQLRRRRTWYTLTDRRAFIATDFPLVGRKLQSYPIGPDTVLDYSPGDLSDIHFAHRTRRTKNGSHRVPVGFDRIPEGETVYRLMRDIQRSAA